MVLFEGGLGSGKEGLFLNNFLELLVLGLEGVPEVGQEHLVFLLGLGRANVPFQSLWTESARVPSPALPSHTTVSIAILPPPAVCPSLSPALLLSTGTTSRFPLPPRGRVVRLQSRCGWPMPV